MARKENIIRCLEQFDVTLKRVPFDYMIIVLRIMMGNALMDGI